MQALVIVVVIALFVALVVLGYISARKRREAMAGLAAKLGLSFEPDKDWDIARRYSFLDKLRAGSNRYAFNILSGSYQGNEVSVFDYHYETYSTDSKGHRQTHHHYFSFHVKIFPLLKPAFIRI